MSSPFVTALFDPLNLMILVVAAAAGLIAAWWLFPLGLLFWLLMVILLARDPGFRLAHTSANRAPLASRYQINFNQIKQAQVGLFNAVSTFNTSTRPQLQSVLNTVNDLVGEVYNLCQRMSALENFRIVSTSNSNLENEMDQLTDRVKKASDAGIKSQYQDALDAMHQRVAKLQEASARLDRVDAELASLRSELNTEITEILQLQSLPVEQVSSEIPKIILRLEERIKEIKEI
jgi:hypothetical protein